MKTNEDFLEWHEEEKDRLTLIAAMKPEYQPEYYLRKGYFANNNELEKAKADALKWKNAYESAVKDLGESFKELNEIKKVDLHSANERIKDLNAYIKDLKKDLDWTTIGWNVETTVGSNCYEIMKKMRVKHKFGE